MKTKINKITILIFYIISIVSFAQMEPDHKLFGEQSKRESLMPIRPGGFDNQHFWNEKAKMFIYAPSFNFNNSSWIVPYPKYYRTE